MAVVLPMAAAHHPSLRPRRLSTPTTWTAAGAPTTTNGERQSVHTRPLPSSRMRPSASRGRSRSRSPSSGPSVDGTPSSPSSRASESPHIGLGRHQEHSGAENNSRSGEGTVLHHNGSGSNVNNSLSANVSVLGSSVAAHRTRRPRRRADEVERLYKCTWNGCEKSYGTLSHLNDHVRLQRHGNKREPHEFKEARRIWRQERKSRRLREHAHAMQAASSSSTTSVALAPASISHPTTTGITSATTSPTYRLISNQDDELALDEDSSREDNEELDFDRSRTPVTPLRRQVNVGPRIAAASDYHTQSTYSDYFINQSQHSHRTTLSTPSSSSLLLHPPMQMQMQPQDHHILSPRPTQSSILMSSPAIDSKQQQAQQQGFRLPSIAELRLDLSLDEYEAHTALGSLSSAASLARPSTAGPLLAMMPGSPSRAVRHHRRRDSWGSPSTSSNASLVQNQLKYAPGAALAPPPPFHLYHSHNGNGNDPATNPTHSPDITNHYRFRVSSVSSATTSPSIDRPSSRTLGHPHSQYPPYSRSHSRTLSSSRPSTSATSTTQPAYPHSTPSHPPSSFPFIPAPPPRITPEASEGEPRRKRRKYEEIERRYLCGWQGCSKAYGTLNHLNDHVSLQGHGPKRRSSGESLLV